MGILTHTDTSYSKFDTAVKPAFTTHYAILMQLSLIVINAKMDSHQPTASLPIFATTMAPHSCSTNSLEPFVFKKQLERSQINPVYLIRNSNEP